MSQHFKELAIRDHLLELRRRLFVSVTALLVTTVLAFVFNRWILKFLLAPAHGFQNTPGGKPVFTEVTEMLGITFKVSLVAGFVLAFPVVLYQVVMFVAPGLTPRERRYLYGFLPGVVLAFAAGVAFGYFVLIPPAIQFLLSWGSDVATPFIRIGNFVNLVVMLLFWMGVVFETPVVMFLLARLGIVSSRQMAKFRRFAAVGAFLLGAVITPTFDPINQGLVALPIIVLYEVGIWLARLAERTRRASKASAAASESTT